MSLNRVRSRWHGPTKCEGVIAAQQAIYDETDCFGPKNPGLQGQIHHISMFDPRRGPNTLYKVVGFKIQTNQGMLMRCR
jgi:hypothetical protein